MTSSTQRLLELVLKPVVRFTLRRSQGLQEFTLAAKRVFVDVAQEELRLAGEKINVSRVSAVTGIYRDEVARLMEAEANPEAQKAAQAGVIPRIIGMWEGSERFTTGTGKPKMLSYRGEQNEFENLVAAVSQHLNPGTVLFELERSGIAERTPRGVKLKRGLSRIGDDHLRVFDLLSRDIDSLIRAAEENALDGKQISNLHIRTEYDNVDRQYIPLIRRYLVDEGKAFHRRMREFLSKFDRDINPSMEPGEGRTGARVVVGAFSFTDFFPAEVEKLPPMAQND